MPGDGRAPVVTDDDAGFLAERPDQIDHVPDQFEDRIVLAPLRPVGPAIAAHVGRHGVIAGCRQGLNLRPPADAQLGEAMDQQNQWAFAGLEDLLVQAVGPDDPGLHGASPAARSAPPFAPLAGVVH